MKSRDKSIIEEYLADKKRKRIALAVLVPLCLAALMLTGRTILRPARAASNLAPMVTATLNSKPVDDTNIAFDDTTPATFALTLEWEQQPVSVGDSFSLKISAEAVVPGAPANMATINSADGLETMRIMITGVNGGTMPYTDDAAFLNGYYLMTGTITAAPTGNADFSAVYTYTAQVYNQCETTVNPVPVLVSGVDGTVILDFTLKAGMGDISGHVTITPQPIGPNYDSGASSDNLTSTPPDNMPTIQKTVGNTSSSYTSLPENQGPHPIDDPFLSTNNASGQFVYKIPVTLYPGGSSASGGVTYGTVKISDVLPEAIVVDRISVTASNRPNSNLSFYDPTLSTPMSNYTTGATLTLDASTHSVTFLMDATTGFPFANYDDCTITVHILAHIDPDADLSQFTTSESGDPLIPNAATLTLNDDASLDSNTVYVQAVTGKCYCAFTGSKSFTGALGVTMHDGEFKFAVIDLNPDSPTYMKVVSIGYSPDGPDSNFYALNFDGKQMEYTEPGMYKYDMVELGFSSDYSSVEVGDDFSAEDITTHPPIDGYTFAVPVHVLVFVTEGSNKTMTADAQQSLSLDTLVPFNKSAVPLFLNTYRPYFYFDITKIVTGTGAPNASFTFTLTSTNSIGVPPASPTIMTGQVNTGGAGTYNLHYYGGTVTAGGTAYFALKESPSGGDGWEYDATQYLLKVAMATDGTPTISYTVMPPSGPLPAGSTWATFSPPDEGAVSGISFTNTYTPTSSGVILPDTGGVGMAPLVITALILTALLSMFASAALIYRRYRRKDLMGM